jgi:hypothetical protein
MLDGLERSSAVILTTTTGRPFKKRHFSSQWSDAMKAAGLESSTLHFNDLRGTAITRLAEAGCTIPQIVAITQHSMATATRILEAYLPRTRKLADQAIARLENASKKETANRLQTDLASGARKSISKG